MGPERHLFQRKPMSAFRVIAEVAGRCVKRRGSPEADIAASEQLGFEASCKAKG
jgi:hypothetical protein